jgi:long-chain fatty acid transport protein
LNVAKVITRLSPSAMTGSFAKILVTWLLLSNVRHRCSQLLNTSLFSGRVLCCYAVIIEVRIVNFITESSTRPNNIEEGIAAVKRNRVLSFAALLPLPVLALSAHTARAAGFSIDFQGARAVGMATAGSADAADASTIFYNPAGLSYLDQNEVIAGGQFFLLKDQFKNTDSTILDGALTTPGTNGHNAIPPVAMPWLFASFRLTPELTAGFGIFSPFGLSTNYGSDFVGRYQNLLTSLIDIDLNPVISYRPLPWLTLAGGVDVQYVHVRLTQAIDFGSACVAALGASTCSSGFGLLPGRSDGYVDNRGDSVGYGFNVGAVVEPVSGTRLGIAYRSGIDLHFGDARQSFTVYPAARTFLDAAGTPLAFTGSRVTTTLQLPARLAFGLKETLLERLDLLLDATFTWWGSFQNTSITSHNPATGASLVIREGYKDAWLFAAGLEYRIDPQFSLRTGVAYDQTPIPPSAVQGALPDRDRVYLSVGASYQLTRGASIDIGYSHLFAVSSVPINRTTSTGDTLDGQFNIGGDIFAAQLRVRY